MILKDYIPFLLKNPLFKDFSEEDFYKFFNNNSYLISNHEKNSFIYMQHEVCESFDIILSGEVQIQTIDENGNILIVTSFKSGDTLSGNLILSDNNTYPMGVIAKENTTLLRIRKSLLIKLCQEDKGFLMEFIRSLSNRTFFLSTKLRTMTTKTIRDQIIDFIKYQYHLQNSNKIKLNMMN